MARKRTPIKESNNGSPHNKDATCKEQERSASVKNSSIKRTSKLHSRISFLSLMACLVSIFTALVCYVIYPELTSLSSFHSNSVPSLRTMIEFIENGHKTRRDIEQGMSEKKVSPDNDIYSQLIQSKAKLLYGDNNEQAQQLAAKIMRLYTQKESDNEKAESLKIVGTIEDANIHPSIQNSSHAGDLRDKSDTDQLSELPQLLMETRTENIKLDGIIKSSDKNIISNRNDEALVNIPVDMKTIYNDAEKANEIIPDKERITKSLIFSSETERGDFAPRKPSKQTSGSIVLNAENSQVQFVFDDMNKAEIIKQTDTLEEEQFEKHIDDTKTLTSWQAKETRTIKLSDNKELKNESSKKAKVKGIRSSLKEKGISPDSAETVDSNTAQNPSAPKPARGKSKVKETATLKKKSVGNPKDSKSKKISPDKQFSPTFQRSFTPKKIFYGGRRIAPVELLHQKPSNSSVRVYLFDDFLSDQECEGLMRAHDSHVTAYTKPPILCFDSVKTLRKHIRDAGKDINVNSKVFTTGTKCVNASFSLQLQSWLNSNWSYSTAFYPGESKFSTNIATRMQNAMGLQPENGGKFQITSYPVGKAYKTHTDCTLEGLDKRDRSVSVLMYLNNSEEGGETQFPELGIWVKPKRGRALVWNNMSPQGICEPHSRHAASVVKQGKKYIMIRWYYYKSFPSLGHRPSAPSLPARDNDQAMVSCDDYNNGSCRWYDEWTYEHLTDYQQNKLNIS
ncbi:prolyl 4-hydroxylase subunit alpha-1-like [Plakobranchus ocellatus]|uniref:Prolyl 4-hydroxylase subunit alpha-1-like n=1 Tax=Plakobranchus ocellatus TaxID=259542 RepID=A0AAV4D166_9GAST|nr:prolyl 4-hydroxylase subunit alpha-1-like [Plakobranchus ocellatus]